MNRAPKDMRAALRRFLLSSSISYLKPYKLHDLTAMAVSAGVVTLDEIASTSVGTVMSALMEEGLWRHNGKHSRASRYERTPVAPKPEPPPMLLDDEEPHRGPVTATMARIERELDIVLRNLGIDPNSLPE